MLCSAATQYELERLIASKPRFSDMFETAAPVSGTPNSCPAGFKAVNTPNSRYLFPQTPAPGQTQAYIECLRVKVSIPLPLDCNCWLQAVLWLQLKEVLVVLAYCTRICISTTSISLHG